MSAELQAKLEKERRSDEREKLREFELRAELEKLRGRLARLEGAPRVPPRGRTNQAGAARYLGISEETLRARHARGEGPRRRRSGTRNWSYTYDDLDAYAEQSVA